MKQCRCCKVEKKSEEFSRRSSNSDGLYSYCRECTRLKNRKLFDKKRDVYKKIQEKYREENGDYLRKKAREYYYENREKVLKKSEKYREKNKKKISLNEAVRRISDPNRFEKNRKKHFEWSKENRERLNEYQRKWYKENKEKRRAHVVLNRAVSSGKLIRPKMCSECKKKCKPDGHHLDYSKPLEVVWICRACHSRKSPRTVIK